VLREKFSTKSSSYNLFFLNLFLVSIKQPSDGRSMKELLVWDGDSEFCFICFFLVEQYQMLIFEQTEGIVRDFW